jgi:hypothetical protein
MEVINIEPSPKTPKVVFDADNDILKIEGRSIPENSTEFYQPIYDWLDEYGTTPNDSTNFVFKLEYFNTSSSKCILDILRKLEKIHEAGNTVEVTWCYEEDDEDMQEAGEDYQGIVKVPISLQSYTD